MQETLIAARHGTTREAVAAFKELGRHKCKAGGPALLSRIADKNAEIRLVCVQESIDILGEAAFEHLVAALRDPVIQIGMIAASHLAWIGTQRAAQVLVQAASGTDQVVQTHGAYGLEFWRSKDGMLVLLEALADRRFPYRGTAALALARSGVREALPALAEAFAHERNWGDKMQMAAALTLLGNDRREFIREGLRSEWSDRRLAALICAQELKDKDAFCDIVPLLHSMDVEVSLQAAETLKAIGVPQKEKRKKLLADIAKLSIKRRLPEGYRVEAAGRTGKAV